MTIVVHVGRRLRRCILLEFKRSTTLDIIRDIVSKDDHDVAIVKLVHLCRRVRTLGDDEMGKAERQAEFTISDDFVTER